MSWNERAAPVKAPLTGEQRWSPAPTPMNPCSSEQTGGNADRTPAKPPLAGGKKRSPRPRKVSHKSWRITTKNEAVSRRDSPGFPVLSNANHHALRKRVLNPRNLRLSWLPHADKKRPLCV